MNVKNWNANYEWFLRNQHLWSDQVRKRRCRSITSYAISLGIIVRPEKCSKCGRTGIIQAHNEGWTDPLAIEWLCCTPCHKQADKEYEKRMGIKRKVIRVRPHPISVHNEARRLWSEGFLSQVEIGRILGIHNSTVSKTVRGVVKGSLKQN